MYHSRRYIFNYLFFFGGGGGIVLFVRFAYSRLIVPIIAPLQTLSTYEKILRLVNFYFKHIYFSLGFKKVT